MVLYKIQYNIFYDNVKLMPILFLLLLKKILSITKKINSLKIFKGRNVQS